MRLGWYSHLDKREKRTYWACFGGFTLDSMDSTIYALVMPVLLTVLGMSKSDAGILSSVALIGSALGGWSAGVLADRYGRIRVMQWTVVWVATFTFLAAFCSSFWEFLPVRFLQGVGYGGEAVVGAVLISEAIKPALRGRVAASIQSGYAIGYAISLGAMPVVFYLFPEDVAWRAFFAIGLLPALLVWFIRRLVPESDTFNKARARDKKVDIRVIFGARHRRVTFISTVLASGIFGGAYIMITWLPTYMRTVLNLPIASTSGYLAVNIIGSLVGPFIYGLISDRVGRGKTFMLFLICQALVVSIYMFANVSMTIILGLGLLLGAFQGGLASGLPLTFSELYPTSIRANGAGFCTSFGRGFGSIMPAAVGFAAAHIGLETAMGAFAIGSYTVGFIAALCLPNATGVDLGAVDAAHEIDTLANKEVNPVQPADRPIHTAQ
ncbi:MFS transporter [Pseudomonas sp. WAC2]|uniref:MFS transporter n=1 Tax=Pseudomonas sp. WAC2 TaxID=3055057 RepID=UPI0025B0D7C6|nr:MFS transporter [Pseudomonas sp. WAC2]MDN3235609.1 MFS transporter [Pseudomonas sp. WAC2]